MRQPSRDQNGEFRFALSQQELLNLAAAVYGPSRAPGMRIREACVSQSEPSGRFIVEFVCVPEDALTKLEQEGKP